MNDIIDAMKALNSFSQGDPASESEISEAESELGLSFADDYKAYLTAFGSMDAYGIELTGLIDDEELHVVSATKEAWSFHNHVPHTFYLLEDAAYDGILVWQDSSGSVYQSTPTDLPTKTYPSLLEYVTRKA